MKLTNSSKSFKKEIEALTKVYKKNISQLADISGMLGKVPVVKDFGKIKYDESDGISNAMEVNEDDLHETGQVLSYVIIQQQGMTLETFFQSHDYKRESILSLGIQLLNIYEQIHIAGYVYNNLKFENLAFDSSFDPNKIQDASRDIFERNNVNIVDFKYATPFINTKTFEHLEQEDVDVFKGNMVFCSTDQHNFKSTSRRDDLISLFYLLVFLMQKGKVPALHVDHQNDLSNEFERVKNEKQNLRTRDLCFGCTKDLKRFKKEVFGYNFVDVPNYEHLRTLLKNIK